MRSRPERQFSIVVFPEPLGPMIATISPGVTEKLTPRSACTSTRPVSYTLSTARASTIGSTCGGDTASASTTCSSGPRRRGSVRTAIFPPLPRFYTSLPGRRGVAIGEDREPGAWNYLHHGLGRDFEPFERLLERLLVLPLVLCHLREALRDRERAGRTGLLGEQRVRLLHLAVLVHDRGAEVVRIRPDEPGELRELGEVLLQLDGRDPLEHGGEPIVSSLARRGGEQQVSRVREGLTVHRGEDVLVRLGVHSCPPISLSSIVVTARPAGIRRTAEIAT